MIKNDVISTQRDNLRTKTNPADSRFPLDLWDFSFCAFFLNFYLLVTS